MQQEQEGYGIGVFGKYADVNESSVQSNIGAGPGPGVGVGLGEHNRAIPLRGSGGGVGNPFWYTRKTVHFVLLADRPPEDKKM